VKGEVGGDRSCDWTEVTPSTRMLPISSGFRIYRYGLFYWVPSGSGVERGGTYSAPDSDMTMYQSRQCVYSSIDSV